MTAEENELRTQLLNLKGAIKDVIHDLSSPLGVLRMTAYYLQHGGPDKEKQDHYFTVIGDTVEKIASGLGHLREMCDDAPESPLPPESPASGPGEQRP